VTAPDEVTAYDEAIAYDEMFALYRAALGEAVWLPVLGALVACAALLLWERLGEGARRKLAWLALAVIGVSGLACVWARASVFDDAYISLRYAQSLLDGHGLIWNAGERVEGYTNFLWTVLLAAIAWLSRVDLAPVSLFASLAAWIGLVLVSYRPKPRSRASRRHRCCRWRPA
jgi:hypothetical protein